MLPEKLSRDQSNDQGLGPESLPIVIETNEGKRERSLVVFLVAVGIGILVLTTIVLLLLLLSDSWVLNCKDVYKSILLDHIGYFTISRTKLRRR